MHFGHKYLFYLNTVQDIGKLDHQNPGKSFDFVICIRHRDLSHLCFILKDISGYIWLWYMLIFQFQAIAGYDKGLDPRQPRDLKIHQYRKQVSGCDITMDVCYTIYIFLRYLRGIILVLIPDNQNDLIV